MEKRELETIIQGIFEEQGLKFEKLDFEDDDLNYEVELDYSKVLKGTGTFKIIMFFSTECPKGTVIIGNLYRFDEHELEKALQYINEINKKLPSGKVVLHEKTNQMVFITSRMANEYSEISSKLVENLIKTSYIAITVIYETVKEWANEE